MGRSRSHGRANRHCYRLVARLPRCKSGNEANAQASGRFCFRAALDVRVHITSRTATCLQYARLFPLVALRLRRFAEANDDSYDLIPAMVYLELSMAYCVASTTIPCLKIFLEGASAHFLDGHNAYAGSTTTARSGYAHELSTLRTRRVASYRNGPVLNDRTNGESTATARKAHEADGVSVGSDCSQRAIIVRSGVSVQYSQA